MSHRVGRRERRAVAVSHELNAEVALRRAREPVAVDAEPIPTGVEEIDVPKV